ncbi:CsgG/HfaB family protein [Candidatus Neomarinimicrobiota bacterium]
MRSHFRYILTLLCLLAASSTAQQTTLAVIDLEGIGVSQSEALALSNRLRNELFRIGSFTVVERGLMEEILGEQDFQQTGCTSNECLVELGRILGVEQMVGGTISRVGTIFSVSARLIAVETGEVLNVSDYDLGGGLEEMLTNGMREVALVLSSEVTGQTAVPDTPPEAVPPSEHEPAPDQSKKPVTSWFAWSTRPEINSWQSRANMAWRASSDHGYVNLSLSRGLDRSLRIRGLRIRPVLMGGYTGRWRRDSDGEETYEYVWHTSLAARVRWAFKDEKLRLSLYAGPGVGWRKYDRYDYTPQRGGILLFVSGVQLDWQFRKFPTLVVDGSLFSTPDYGRTAMLSFGLQGPFLSGGLPGVVSLVLTAFLFDFSSAD